MSELFGDALLDALESGEVRAAYQDQGGQWRANLAVKEELLRLFRESPVVPMPFEAAHSDPDQPAFVDKEFLPLRRFQPASGVRLVPGGSAVRRGAHLAQRVVCMPPMYVNVGAFVGEGSMVDSHALVGSCAQIGRGVHLSAAAQIGGVLEPPSARPVIIEDDAFIGGGCGVYEGVLIGEGAVVGAGVVLSATTVVYDLVRETELRSTRENPLEIPARAVLVPGSRPTGSRGGDWARERGLQIACALIVKYRDDRTDAATALEDALR